MVRVKGSAVTTRIRYVRELYGESGYRKVLDALAPAHRAVIEARVLPHAWVPYDLFIDLNVTIDRLYGAGDLRLCYEMGRYGAEVNLPTLYRIFYRVASPMFIFGKAARLWEVHYDSGRLVPEEEGPGKVRLRVEDFARPHPAHCASVRGWAARSIELSGATLLLQEEARCRTRGDAVCEYRFHWR
jgi:hypothetical protein